MKTSILISSSALLVSLVALTLEIRTPRPPTQAQIDAMVDSRLVDRELAFVQTATPKFKRLLGTDDPKIIGDKWSPKTLEELFDPIGKMIETMGEDSSPTDLSPSIDNEHNSRNDNDKPSN